MAKRPTRLRFTEDVLADSRVKKAADRADKAVDKAEKAADKLASKKAKPKLKLETDAAGSRKAYGGFPFRESGGCSCRYR